ncbi:MAG TPA: hypothetical protein VMF52_14315 [Steroidobacteraceae bacterium]|nr:hypothetical protein [Steroidobacteraceae bacterium]
MKFLMGPGIAALATILAMQAGAADDPLPHRPLTPRETGVAPPARIPPSAETLSPLPAGTPVGAAAVPRAVRRAVVADAARRFKVAESAVVLTRLEQVTWSDGSLGCPEPGVMYTQNLVPGYLLVAKTPEGELAYHTDSRERAVTCGAGRPVKANKLSEKAPVRGAQPGVEPVTPDR